MIIIEILKWMYEMNNLQMELKTAQKNKLERQDQLEPLQEKVVKIIAEMEVENTRMAQVDVESVDFLKEDITMCMVEELTEKVPQAKSKWEELEGKFHDLEKVVQGVHTT
jgi:predicted  nucleic acid-binding Zn-ribbon protein